MNASQRHHAAPRPQARAKTLVLWLVFGPTIAAGSASVATPLADVRVSSDTTVALGTATFGPEAVVRDDLHGTFTAGSLGAIPSQANLDAYHRLSNGHQLLSFDTTVGLPGDVSARPADVVDYDGASYTIVFDGAARGVPDGADVDTVTVRGGALLLSFDTTVDLGGVHAEDEDLVMFDADGFSLFFDGSAAGIDPSLDLDGADLLECNDHLLLSFDGSGTVGGVGFDDEDVLEFDRVSTWSMGYDGSAQDPDWSAADLDAISATVDLGPGPPAVFGQTVRVDADKTTLRWTSTALYRAVRGAFAAPGNVGAYLVTQSWSGSGSSFADAAVPSSGTGLWYLVRRGGCIRTSWQSTLGAEPGRDATLP